MTNDLLTVLVVDDEPLARTFLADLLRAESVVETVLSATNADEAVAMCRDGSVDIVFLDIQMPGKDGFSVIESLGLAQMPVVVFVTAFDEYAVRAFEHEAVDYLLKPFDEDRFLTAFKRAIKVVHQEKSAAFIEQYAALMKMMGRSSPEIAPPDQEEIERFVVKSAGRVQFVPIGDVQWMQSAGNYIELHTEEAVFILRGAIKDIEDRLPRNFVRIHRSTIVDAASIMEMRPVGHGEYSLLMKKGAKLKLSRGYKDMGQQLMDQQTHSG